MQATNLCSFKELKSISLKEYMVSIIICTYNGAAKISGVLKTVHPLVSELVEIIVVVDGSTDETVKVLENFTGISVLQQVNQGRARAKNNGAKFSKGDLLLFLDDDMRLMPDSMTLHLAHHANHPDTLLVGKIAMDPALIQTDFHRYLCHLTLKWHRQKCKISLDRGRKTRTRHTSLLVQGLGTPASQWLIQIE